jgi:uncharacterized spore protein YtfJ
MANTETPVLESIREALGRAGANAIFGAPVTQDGVTVIPVAKLNGGGGGGGGEGEGMPSEGGSGRGSGGGFGLAARPVGAFVIKDGAVSWRPTIDVNKIIVGGQLVAVAALLTVRTIVRRLPRHGRKR